MYYPPRMHEYLENCIFSGSLISITENQELYNLAFYNLALYNVENNWAL
jgi:hypothetical protein